ncbi:MAG TPA: hypothetical protein VM573_02245, partial [Actinomycetota bacterium]|nr:hypothetical protein [Actinomycetota bacterium]
GTGRPLPADDEELLEPDDEHSRFLLSGADAAIAWTVDADLADYLWPLERDATGDGRADFVAIDFLSRSDRYVLVSGRDGALHWEEPVQTDGFLVTLAPARLRGPAPDLLETSFSWWGDTATRSRARAGGTGAALWVR